ncbi:MFS transporter [Actinomadura fibrosa]|uniref:MFS transporter n=1 Tax=Actinomadura fibrosa TaxID=111802 RepID=A0ABW2XQ69_9ACTN
MGRSGAAATRASTTITRGAGAGARALYAVYAAEGLAFAAVISRSPELQRAHELSDDAINLLVVCIPVLAVAGGLLAARLAARTGSGPVLRWAQVLFPVAVLLIGLPAGLGGLLAALALFALSMGVLDAAMNAQAVAAQRRAGRSMVNGFFAVFSAMGIAGSLWISLANHLDLSLAAGFAPPAAVGLLIALGIARARLPGDAPAVPGDGARGGPGTSPAPLPGDSPVVPEEGARGAPGDHRPLADQAPTVPWRPLLVIGGVLACAYVAEGAVTGFAVKYVQDGLGGSASVAPLAITAFALATVLGRSVADRAVGRWGAARLARAGGAVALAGLVTVAAAPGPAAAIAGFGLAGLGLCSMAPSAYATAGSRDPGGRGVAVARVGVFNYVGFVSGTVMVAAVHPLSGYRAGYAVAAAALVVVVALAGRLSTGTGPATTPADRADPAAPVTGAPGPDERPAVDSPAGGRLDTP